MLENTRLVDAAKVCRLGWKNPISWLPKFISPLPKDFYCHFRGHIFFSHKFDVFLQYAINSKLNQLPI